MRKRAPVTQKTLKKFPNEVASELLRIIGLGVKHRQIDGSHVLLYPLDGTSRPFKVSASRPAQASLHYIEDFLEQNRMEQP
jgi:hypothetical protein